MQVAKFSERLADVLKKKGLKPIQICRVSEIMCAQRYNRKIYKETNS